MCLIITIICTAIYSGIYFFHAKEKKVSKSLFTVIMMHLSAALMWCVDGIANVAGGERFFDISMEDFILGMIIAVLGLCVYGVLILSEKIKAGKKLCI